MNFIRGIMLGAMVMVVVVPASVLGVVEEKTGMEYPDTMSLDCGGSEAALEVTGVGLREKTFMKVDVYTIVSYVAAGSGLPDKDTGPALAALQAPKVLQMDLRRGFSKDKLINAFVEVIDKNYEDQSAFAADMTTFTDYFTRDAQDKDQIIFAYCPGTGLTTTLNGKISGVIPNPAFAEALWSVWFGPKCANNGLRKKMLAEFGD